MGRYLNNGGGAATLPNSGVTAGSYSNTDLVVNSQGIIVSASNGASGAAALGSLSDVILTGAIANQIISFDGTDWRNITLNIIDVNDVSITAPSTGDFLTFNGVDWVNTAINVLTSADIGSTIQAWDSELDSIAGLTGTGYIAHTAPGIVAERSIVGAGGINVNNGDGVLGNTEISVSINALPFTAPVDPTNDLILFYNFDTNQNEQVSIEDAVLSAVPVTGALSIGGGFNIFKANNNGTLEIREITSGSSSIVIDMLADTIRISGTPTLDALSALTPTNNSFIVGNGTAWGVEDAITARTTLGLGTMALASTTDYLAVAGGAMTGTIDMASNQINSLANPTSPQDAATKSYVDNNVATGGAGLIKTGNQIDIVNNDGSIDVLVDEISVNTVFMDVHNDARYFTQTKLGDTTNGTEGASLIGTELKTNLNNATTVEAALNHINAELPFAHIRFRQDISVWNLDITTPSATRATINNVEVARFSDGINAAVYKDLLLPFDYDGTKDLSVYVAMGKEHPTSGNISMAMAWQHQRVPGFTADDVKVVAPGLTIVPDASLMVWTIPAGTFQALDVITLRLTRLGGDIGDTYTGAMDLFAAHITQ